MNCIHVQCQNAISVAAGATGDMLFLASDRLAYSGLLGSPSPRVLGSISVYFSLGQPFRISLQDGQWCQADLAVIPPYLPHSIASEDNRIAGFSIEPDTVDMTRLPPLLRGSVSTLAVQEELYRLRAGLASLGQKKHLTNANFDELFFGECLRPRQVDKRIAEISRLICAHPYDPHDAETCASLARLSPSRFLHLFTAELGMSFRRYRAWKRARHMLHYVKQQRCLTDIALDLGYPDSTHFSHSIRTFYGLRPKDIFSGSRRLAVFAEAPIAQPLACVA